MFIKNKWYFTLLTGSYAVSGLTVLVTKLLVRRPRPLVALIEIPKSYSFPSGHTLTSIVFLYGIMAFTYKKIQILLIK
ncbi:MAG: phosphatase PAP2 family protein [Clostridium sp.]|nr:MAG: phosphatase PAP2 family protein [Clostridium sp.]